MRPDDPPVPLIEREREMSLLLTLAAEAAEGQSRVALVTGEGGVGKSRLCAEFARSLPEPWTADGDAGERVVIVEDLHDRGPDDVAGVIAVAERPGTLVLATCRLESVPPSSDLASALLGLLRAPHAIEVRLSCLSAAGVSALAAELGADLGCEAASELVQRSGGNPFYVGELLRARDQGVPWTVAASVSDRLARIDGPADATLAALSLHGAPMASADVRTVVPDAPIQALVRSHLVSWSGDRVELRHHIVGEVVLDGHTEAEISAMHLRIADVLSAAEPPDPVALTHHLRAGGDHRSATRSAWPAALASARDRYYFRATQLFEFAICEIGTQDLRGTDLERAALAAAAAGRIDLAERWARAAECAYRDEGDEHRASALWLDHGLRYVRRPEVEPDDLAVDTTGRLSVEATIDARAGRFEEARAAARHAFAVAEAAADSDAGAQAAMALLLAGAPDEAKRALETLRQEAIAVADPQLEGRRSSELARFAFSVGDVAGAEAHQRAAVAACARVPEGGEEQFMQLGLAATLATIGRLDEAEAIATPFVDDRNFIVGLMAHAPLTIADVARGDIDSARRRLALLAPYRDLAGQDVFSTALADEILVAMHDGALDRAATLVDDAESWIGGLFEATRPDRLEAAVRVAVLRDDGETLTETVVEIDRIARTPSACAGLVGLAEWARGQLAFRDGRFEVAHAQLSSGARRLMTAPRLVQAADAWCDAAVAALRLGDRAAVAAALSEADELAGAGGYGLVRRRVGSIVAACVSASPVDRDLARLTPRERSILEHLVAGCTNKEIAAALFLSEKTIRNQLSLLFAKLGFERRSQAAAFAARHGLGVP